MRSFQVRSVKHRIAGDSARSRRISAYVGGHLRTALSGRLAQCNLAVHLRARLLDAPREV